MTESSSKHFCILPWIHLHAVPSGAAFLCCHAKNSSVGSLKENSLQEIWNNDAMKEVRLNMLNDRPSKECTRCYEQEKHSMHSSRKMANKNFAHHIPLAKDTNEDGSYDDFKLRKYDISATNLCNVKCRSCTSTFSSKWAEEDKREGKYEGQVIKWAGKHEDDVYEQVKPHVPYIEQYFFDGGEPLIMEHQYKLLNDLIAVGKTDVRLSYNTNLTRLKFKDQDILKLWSKFSNVMVGASLDASYERGEYLRKDTVWSDIVANRKRLQEEAPNVNFYVACTVSAYNILHITDFHREWVELGLINPSDFAINALYSPAYMKIDVLPQHLKEQAKEKIEKHLVWLKPLDTHGVATDDFQGLINMMMHKDESSLIPKLLEETAKIDKIRNESLFDIFPELKDIKSQ